MKTNMIQNKINKYRSEEKRFRRKYGCGYEAFKARLAAMENEENFEWEDDLLDWEFAITNLRTYEQKSGLP